MTPTAIIFDLDGTLIDNNPYHFLAWQEVYKGIGKELTAEHYRTKMNGKTNRNLFNDIYERDLPEDEFVQYSNDKEAMYRKIYEPHIAPVDGLIDFLETALAAGIPMAIATSGIPVNIEFFFAKLPLRKYFKAVVDSTYITKGKPDPEIYLKAAEILGVEPTQCIAFEDALAGIASAKAAGMKVVALATSHSRAELEADLIVDNYSQVSLADLEKL